MQADTNNNNQEIVLSKIVPSNANSTGAFNLKRVLQNRDAKLNPRPMDTELVNGVLDMLFQMQTNSGKWFSATVDYQNLQESQLPILYTNIQMTFKALLNGPANAKYIEETMTELIHETELLQKAAKEKAFFLEMDKKEKKLIRMSKEQNQATQIANMGMLLETIFEFEEGTCEIASVYQGNMYSIRSILKNEKFIENNKFQELFEVLVFVNRPFKRYLENRFRILNYLSSKVLELLPKTSLSVDTKNKLIPYIGSHELEDLKIIPIIKNKLIELQEVIAEFGAALKEDSSYGEYIAKTSRLEFYLKNSLKQLETTKTTATSADLAKIKVCISVAIALILKKIDSFDSPETAENIFNEFKELKTLLKSLIGTKFQFYDVTQMVFDLCEEINERVMNWDKLHLNQILKKREVYNTLKLTLLFAEKLIIQGTSANIQADTLNNNTELLTKIAKINKSFGKQIAICDQAIQSLQQLQEKEQLVQEQMDNQMKAWEENFNLHLDALAEKSKKRLPKRKAKISWYDKSGSLSKLAEATAEIDDSFQEDIVEEIPIQHLITTQQGVSPKDETLVTNQYLDEIKQKDRQIRELVSKARQKLTGFVKDAVSFSMEIQEGKKYIEAATFLYEDIKQIANKIDLYIGKSEDDPNFINDYCKHLRKTKFYLYDFLKHLTQKEDEIFSEMIQIRNEIRDRVIREAQGNVKAWYKGGNFDPMKISKSAQSLLLQQHKIKELRKLEEKFQNDNSEEVISELKRAVEMSSQRADEHQIKLVQEKNQQTLNGLEEKQQEYKIMVSAFCENKEEKYKYKTTFPRSGFGYFRTLEDFEYEATKEINKKFHQKIQC